MVFRRNRLLTLFLILGVVGAVWILLGRYRVEMRNRAVEIAVDYPEVAKLAGTADLTVPETLRQLKTAGVTSVSVQERTVADLVALGTIDVLGKRGSRSGTYLGRVTPSILEALRAAGLQLDSQVVSSDGTMTVKVKAEPEFVLAQPVGLSDEAINAAKEANVRVIARMVNRPGCRQGSIDRTLSQIKREGITTVIFAADEVMGFRGGIEEVAKALKDDGLVYGSIEFAKQKGDMNLSQKMLPEVVRVHSITAAEMGTLDKPTAIDRFAKAAKERNIRLAYVRMFDFGDSNPLKTNLDYISAITGHLRAEGMGIGPAKPFKEAPISQPALLLIALGAAAGVALLVLSVVKLSPGITWAGYIVTVLVFAGLIASGILLGLKLVALIVSIVFPTLAVLVAVNGTPDQPRDARLRSYGFQALGRFIGAVVISGCGGFMLAALLSRIQFMLHIEQFAGVKFAHFLPILLVGSALAVGIGWGPALWREQKERVVSNLKRLGSEPVLFWQVGISIVLLVMLAVVLMRSGNEPGVGVSSLELKFRAILDKVLIVRPRTKEFLVGHPAMILGIAAALGGRRGWAALLLVIGTIGEVSLVNTFCHIHTPIEITVLRVTIGAVIGAIIGMALLWIFSRPDSKVSRQASKQAERATTRVQK